MLWMRSESAIETRWHHKRLSEVFVQLSWLNYHCVFLRLWALHKQIKQALVVLLEILVNCHGDHIFFTLNVYLSVEQRRVLCACWKCTPSYGVFNAIPPRQMKMLVRWNHAVWDSTAFTFGVFYSFEDAAGSHWRRRPLCDGGLSRLWIIMFVYLD